MAIAVGWNYGWNCVHNAALGIFDEGEANGEVEDHHHDYANHHQDEVDDHQDVAAEGRLAKATGTVVVTSLIVA